MERRQVARGQWDFGREHAVFGRHRTGTAVESTHSEAEGARGLHYVCFPIGRTKGVDRSVRPFCRIGRVVWWLAARKDLV